MKARVKATGEVVEVEKKICYFHQFNGGERRYEADELEMPTTRDDVFESAEYWKAMCETLKDTATTDWQAYRMEVAKECAAHLLSTNNPEGGWEEREIALMSVDMADALIARLKEQKGE